MKRILSIDDEPMILECIKEALSREGYAVEVTSDPDEGLRLLKERDDIDLALLDIRMPGRSGFDIYREYRKAKKIPAIFVTAYPASFHAGLDEVVEMWRTEFAEGETDIVYKPFDLTTLFDKIDALIGPPDNRERTP